MKQTPMIEHGFTLIELLTTIAIIGILAGIVAVSLASSRHVARDRRRVGDINLIAGALKAYVHDGHTATTSPDGGGCPGDWDCSDLGGFVDILEPDYFSSVPVDPVNTSTNRYLYRGVTSSTPGTMIFTCPTPYYVLVAMLETTGVREAQNDQTCLDVPAAGGPTNTDSVYYTVGR